MIGHIGNIVGPFIDRIEISGQAISFVVQARHGLDTESGLLGAQAFHQTLRVLAAPPFIIFASRPAQIVYGIDIVNQGIVRETQIRVTVHTTTVQATALIAVVTCGVEFIKVNPIVQAADNRVGLTFAKRAIVGTTVAGHTAITELVAVAKCI